MKCLPDGENSMCKGSWGQEQASPVADMGRKSRLEQGVRRRLRGSGVSSVLVGVFRGLQALARSLAFILSNAESH